MNSESETTEFERSRGNVFADLAIPDAEQELAKADLAIEITRLIRERNLTQMEAAELLGTAQSKISAIRRGRLAHFTYDRLLRFLNLLGCNVQIVVTPVGDAASNGVTMTDIIPAQSTVRTSVSKTRREAKNVVSA